MPTPSRRIFSGEAKKVILRELFILLFLYAVGLGVLFLIVLLKRNSAFNFFDNPFLYGYTFFVTIFRISRIWAALFYEKADKKLLEPYAQMHYEPAISFVIPCKNEEAAIEKTVTKCFEARYPPEKVEVIVVNDGSTDSTGAILGKLQFRFPNLTVVSWEQNRGKRHGMAEGFRRARGEVVVQLDSDSYIEPGTIQKLVDYFKNPQVGAVCAHTYVENADQNILTRMQTAHYFVAFRVLKAAESAFSLIFCCSGCSSAYRKSVVLPVIDEWLNESFLGVPANWGDDRALTNRVIRQGYKSVYTDKAWSFTIVPDTWKKFVKQQIRWKKGWFVNSLFAGKFIMKRDSFVAVTYFFPLFLTHFLSPFIAVKVFMVDALIFGVSPLYYIIGASSVIIFFIIFYKILRPEDKYWPYLIPWALLNALFLSYVLFWALATIRNRGWGTR